LSVLDVNREELKTSWSLSQCGCISVTLEAGGLHPVQDGV